MILQWPALLEGKLDMKWCLPHVKITLNKNPREHHMIACVNNIKQKSQ